MQRTDCCSKAAAGMLRPSHFFADSDQRTVATGKALAEGIVPGCNVAVHAPPEGTHDPLFHSLSAGVGHPDYALAAAALAGRIGNNPSGLVDAYGPTLKAMEEILSQCNSRQGVQGTD